MKRPQFSLRTLFVVVTILALPMGWLAWNAWQVRQRERFQQRFGEDEVMGIRRVRLVGEEATPPLIWRLFGAKPEDRINLSREKFTDDEIQQIEALFPEADICISDHHSFGWPPDHWGAHLNQDNP
jgi:hypothetical protein